MSLLHPSVRSSFCHAKSPFSSQSAVVATAALTARSLTAASFAGAREFTMDLRCGSIGVKADQMEAIRLAGKYGFESVTPNPSYLSKLNDGQRDELKAVMKSKRLGWGAAGLPVDVRVDEQAFREQLKKLPELAAGMQRCGVTRVGTWVPPNADNDF